MFAVPGATTAEGPEVAEPASGPAAAATPAGVPDGQRANLLASYVPRLALEWVAASPGERYRTVDGTVVFVDVAGFTALTERLAVRGRAGAEEINEIVGSTFSELAGIAGKYGADLLKWGGDAAILLFDGPGSISRGVQVGWLLARAMRRLGRLRTSVGRVNLEVSVGVHSGVFDMFLLGDLHRELIIAGHGATRTAEMEAIASAGEVVISGATAALLDPEVLGEVRGDGVLLRSEPGAEERPVAPRQEAGADAAALLLPDRVRRYLVSDDEEAEHRPVATCFIQVSGLDALIDEGGGQGAVSVLGPLVSAAQAAAERYEVTFHGTDLSADGVKIILLGGVPRLEGNDADRLLRCALEVVGPGPDDTTTLSREASGAGAVPLTLRAGVNVGRTFVYWGLRLGGRRIHSITGDAVNLAARVVMAAAPGEVLCTEATRVALHSPFRLRPRPPFAVKGKSEPVVAFAVSEEGASAPGTGQWQPAFVGRGDELKALLAAAADIRSGGRGKVVDLVGPAGIGKSRLIDEVAPAWRVTTWRIPCDAFGDGRPYRPLRAMARQLLGLDDDAARSDVAPRLTETLERSAPALLPWAPLLADVFDVPVAPRREVDELEPRFRRRRLEAAFVELAGRLVPGPAAFVFEDTHSLDEASWSLVLRIAEETVVRPWLVVTTRRPDGPGSLEGAAAGRVVLEMGALDGGSSERLITELSGDKLSSQERQALVDRASGNPLFLLELARAVQVTGSAEALPDALEPLLAARIDRLSPVDRRALRTAAVLGLRFDEELLAAVIDDARLIDQGLWARLAEFVRDEAGEHLFSHALVRDAAYEGLSFRRRRELHARAAAAIEERAAGPDTAVELLSLHWLAAERWDRAWECARLAGKRAATLHANADAATHFQRALAAARHLRDLPAPEVARVGELLGDTCELSGAYERARGAYDDALRRVAGGVDRARLLRKVGVLHERRGGYSQALRCYTGALRRLDRDAVDVRVERCELELARAGVRHRQWRLRDSDAAAAAAAEVATRAGYRSGLGHSLQLRHINSVYLNEPEDALGYEALKIFVELGDLVGQGNVLNNLGISAYYRGAWDEALEHYGASRDARERTGDLVGAATEENNIGEVLSDQRHYAEAGRRFAAAGSSWRAARYRVGEALAMSNLGRLAARTGRTLEGAELLERARGAFEAIHAGSFVDETDLRLLECTLLAGELKQVAAAGADLAARFAGRPGYARLHAATLRLQATALTHLGDHGAAEPMLDESVDRLREISDSYELAQALQARAALGRSLGPSAAGRAADDDAEAQALFTRLGVMRVPGL